MARLAVLLLALCVALPAAAQTRIVAVVNGAPITSYDLDQRTKLLRLTGVRKGTRNAALNELINEAVQNGAVKSSGIRVSGGQIDQVIGNIAKGAKISTKQLKGALRQSGIAVDTLRDRISAQIGFSQLVRARFNRFATVTEQDLVAALRRDKSLDRSVETPVYDLRRVTIALPQNPPARRLSREMARAKQLRSGFQSCTSGLPTLRKTRNVVVKSFGKRMGIEFSPQMQELLGKTSVGKLSEPVQLREGIVMFAICNKEMVQSTNAAMKALEPGIRDERGEAFSKQYLRQLKRDAVIERRI
ncbi:MAG: SurA N-terminal domain-containing protein [Pseudomonadota bacterium]